MTSTAERPTAPRNSGASRAEHTTLNEQFRRWLADYAQAQQRLQRCDEVMSQLRGRLEVGRKLTRDEMNER